MVDCVGIWGVGPAFWQPVEWVPNRVTAELPVIQEEQPVRASCASFSQLTVDRPLQDGVTSSAGVHPEATGVAGEGTEEIAAQTTQSRRRASDHRKFDGV